MQVLFSSRVSPLPLWFCKILKTRDLFYDYVLDL